MLVEHLDEDTVAPSVGRHELEQQLPLSLLPLDVLVAGLALGDGFPQLRKLDADLHMSRPYVAMEVLVVAVLVGHGADEVEGDDDSRVIVLVERVGRKVVVAVVDVHRQRLVLLVLLAVGHQLVYLQLHCLCYLRECI